MRGPLLLGLLLGMGSAGASTPSGEDLYLGRAPLAAQLRGDDTPLPATAVACVQCHEPAARPGAALPAANIGPRLDAGLLQSRPRRGGPPVPFDEAAFCRLLRTGVDPAMVLVRRTMPQFRLDDGDCTRLWQYLSQRPLEAER